MDNIVFWILWSATLLLAGWVVVEGLLKPRKLLEWPFLCSVMWLYFYVYMAYDAAQQFEAFITPKAFILGQLIPLLSLAGILYGWKLGKGGLNISKKAYPRLENQNVILAFGILLIFVGSYGGYLVQAEREAGTIDYKNTSAYIYLSFYVGYPGLALCLWVASKSREAERRLLFGFTLTALAIFLYPHVSYLRRGPTFPAIMLLLLVPPIATKKPPNRTLYLGGVVGLGIVMLAYLPLRKVIIYNEGTWDEAFAELSLTEAVTERGKDIFDNEYVNNCHMIEALAANGKYQFGSGHGSLLLHWVPKSIWKGKPALGEGIYTYEELFYDVAKSAGIELLGGGAAAGGVADAFVQYGFLTPLFFCLLGYLVSKAYWKGRFEGNIYAIHIYFAIVAASHWLISQGLAAAFVPLLAFAVIPYLTLKVLGHIKPAERSAVGQIYGKSPPQASTRNDMNKLSKVKNPKEQKA